MRGRNALVKSLLLASAHAAIAPRPRPLHGGGAWLRAVHNRDLLFPDCFFNEPALMQGRTPCSFEMTDLGKSASHDSAATRGASLSAPTTAVTRREAVLKKSDAQAIKDLALQAISDLTRILLVSKDSFTEEEFHDLTKAVGNSIGHIEMDILSKIYSQYPELDDIG
jgi:hypothetical protein